MFEQRRIVVSIIVTLVLLLSSIPLVADDKGDQGTSQLVGTWRLIVTGPGGCCEFFSLMTFHKGNTLTERNSVAPGDSSAAGIWDKVDGRTFSVTMEQFSGPDAEGFFTVRLQVRLTLELVDKENLTGTASFDVLSLDGGTVLAGPFEGFLVEGTRMLVVPE